jgi:hypothetical protein
MESFNYILFVFKLCHYQAPCVDVLVDELFSHYGSVAMQYVDYWFFNFLPYFLI